MTILSLAVMTVAVAQDPALEPPVLRSCPEAVRPDGAPEAQEVVLELLVDAQGLVQDVVVIEGLQAFGRRAAEAAAGCTFEPAREAGQAIPVRVPLTWPFPAALARIEGVARRRGSGASVPGLTLQVGEWSVRTDAEGRWALELPGGTYAITPRARWVDPEPSTLSVAAGDRAEVELWLSADFSDELVAVYRGADDAMPPMSMTAEQARSIPGSLGDPVRALHSRPGLTRTPFDAGWLLVRGGDFDDTGIFLEGVQMPLLFHLGGFTSVLHPEMTESVAYWPGLVPSRYRATSGAVDVTTRDIGDRFRTVAGVNTVYAHAFAEVPTQWGGVAVASRRSWLDAVLALALSPEQAAIAPRFLDGQAHVQAGHFDLMLVAMSDSFDAPSASDSDLLVTIVQEGVQLQGSATAEVGDTTFTAAPWIANQVRTLDAEDGTEEQLGDLFPGLRLEMVHAGELDLTIGGELEYHLYTVRQGVSGRYYATRPMTTTDPYLSVGAGDVLRMEADVRLDTAWVQGQDPRVGLSPRTQVRWRATEALSVHGELGRTHGMPLTSLVVGVPEGAYLPLERADSAALGARLASGAFAVAVDAYQRMLGQLTIIERDGSVIVGSGSARGVEGEVRWRRDILEVSSVVQLVQSEHQEDVGSEPYKPVLDQPIRTELLAIASLPRRWTLSSRFRATSGFPRRDGQPRVARDLLRGEEIDLDLARSDPRLPAYYALDLRAAHRVLFRRATLDIWLDVQNVTNRRVAEPLITGFGESVPEYGFGLPILPIFGLEATFWSNKTAPGR